MKKNQTKTEIPCIGKDMEKSKPSYTPGCHVNF